MPEWTVEPMSLDRDLDDLVALDVLCFTNPTSRDMFRWEAEKSDVARVYVMRDAVPSPDDRPPPDDRAPLVAYCAVWLIFDELHINTLAVHPAQRRQGAASHLLRHVLAEAVRQGVTKATLEVRRSNEAARKLYEHFGFAVEGVRKAYYRAPVEDALILWRTGLGPPADSAPVTTNGAA